MIINKCGGGHVGPATLPVCVCVQLLLSGRVLCELCTLWSCTSAAVRCRSRVHLILCDCSFSCLSQFLCCRRLTCRPFFWFCVCCRVSLVSGFLWSCCVFLCVSAGSHLFVVILQHSVESKRQYKLCPLPDLCPSVSGTHSHLHDFQNKSTAGYCPMVQLVQPDVFSL